MNQERFADMLVCFIFVKQRKQSMATEPVKGLPRENEDLDKEEVKERDAKVPEAPEVMTDYSVLAPDVVRSICCFLDYRGVTGLMVSSKALYRTCCQMDVWKRLYLTRFPVWNIKPGVSIHSYPRHCEAHDEGRQCAIIAHHSGLVNSRRRNPPDWRIAFARRMKVIDTKRMRYCNTMEQVNRQGKDILDRITSLKRKIQELRNEEKALQRRAAFIQNGGVAALYSWATRKRRRKDPFLPVTL
jgi:hypothetical protein